MSYKYYFFDDQTVGAEDLNKLVKMFVTNGVADNFQDGMPYSLSKFNDTVYANVSAGIVPQSVSSLKVSTNAGFAYIEPGIAFFKDGTVIEIESTETLSLDSGKSCYVYLKSDGLENRAYPEISESLPENENIVPLAHISESGSVTDLRRFAKGKVPSFYASDTGVRIENNIVIDYNSEYAQNGKKFTLIDSNSTYRYIVLICRHYFNEEIGNIWVGTFVYDTETGTYYNFSVPGNGRYHNGYVEVNQGTSFHLLDHYWGNFHFLVFGELFFTGSKAEMKIECNYGQAIEENFKNFAFPLEIKAIAC